MGFGRWLALSSGVVVIVAVVQYYDERLALALALVTLLAVLFHNRAAFAQLIDILHVRSA